MAKSSIVPFPTPEFKLPKLDLDALFAVQKANLAAVQEAQSVLLGAAEAIAKVQHGYAEQVVAELKATLESKELPRPESLQAAGEQAIAVTKEVVDLTITANKRVAELLSARGQASVEELKAFAA